MKPDQKKKRKKRNRSSMGGQQTFMKLSRSLSLGGVQIKRYSKKLASRFNDYTQGDANERRAERRQEWLDNLFTTLHLDFFRGHAFMAFLSLLGVLLVVMLLMMDNSDISVDRATLQVAGLGSDFEGYSILLLSDLNGETMGDNQVKLLNVINSLDYDIAVFAGDMVGSKGDVKPLLTLIQGMPSSKPIYFVAGDSDPGPLLETPRPLQSATLEQFVLEDWILMAEGAGAIYLDTSMPLRVGSSTLWLTPASLLNINASETLSRLNRQASTETNEVVNGLTAAYHALPLTSYRAQCMSSLLTAVKQMKDSDLHIAVSHCPPTENYLLSAYTTSSSDSFLRPVDLVLAGHYCGGNWKVPFLGALYIPAPESERHGWFPARSTVEGYRLIGSTAMYVTGGLATSDAISTPSFRLNNKSKVTLLTLSSAMTNDLMVND